MKNIIKIAAFLFSFLLFNLSWFSACNIISAEEELTFVLPGDFNGTAVDSWKIRWIDSDGNPQSRVYMPGKSVSITAAKNSVTPVLASPVYRNKGTAAECYGLLYPFTDWLSYKTGFVAGIFYSLWIQSTDGMQQKQRWINFFNWRRFLEECSRFENPWLLDRERILKAIAAGSFKKSDLRIKNR